MEQGIHGAEAVHLTDGDNHIVGVKLLRVMICKDSGMWFAQGLEIDYAACGETIEETQDNFLSGMKKTIAEHLKMHGSIDRFLKVAPQEAWDEYYKGDISSTKKEITTLDFYELQPSADSGMKKEAPFNIEFMELNAA